MDRKSARLKAIKWICLSVLMLLVFTLQSTPSFLSIRGIKPVLLLPLAVSISMFEVEFAGIMSAMCCGLLWDISGESLFGAYGILFLAAGVATTLLMKHLLRNEWFNCLFLVAAFSLVIFSSQFLFTYAIYGYEHVEQIFLYRHLPMMAYTVAVSPALYFTVKLVERIKPQEG